MKKFWIVLLIALAPDGYTAEPRLLQYNYNDIVTISISNVACPLAKLAKTHPYVAIAVKYTDKEHVKVADAMNACWTNKGDDIEIQWVGGDKSVFPANYFLIKGNV
jgi:hypothetical protein